jgi:predicted nucleic acid-binding protein
MREALVLDTSALIAETGPPVDVDVAISAVSISELHLGLLVAGDADERARRAQRLGAIEATFEPLPFDAAAAREWGRLSAVVLARGAAPRRRAMDLAIAATANANGLALFALDDDFDVIDDLVDLRRP